MEMKNIASMSESEAFISMKIILLTKTNDPKNWDTKTLNMNFALNKDTETGIIKSKM